MGLGGLGLELRVEVFVGFNEPGGLVFRVRGLGLRRLVDDL